MPENESSKISFGGRLKQAISVLRINQKKFSELTKIPQSTISQIIKGGEPNAETIKKIASAGINTHWLITGEGEMIVNITTEKTHDEKPLKISKDMSRKEELILRLMERFSRMDPEKLARWERVIDAMLENPEAVETPPIPEQKHTEYET